MPVDDDSFEQFEQPVCRYSFEQSVIPSYLNLTARVNAGGLDLHYSVALEASEAQSLIEQLQTLLPYCTITDDGITSLTLWFSGTEQTYTFYQIRIRPGSPGYGVSDAEIIQHRSQIIAAAREYRILADRLGESIEHQYGIHPPSGKYVGEKDRTVFPDRIDGVWRFRGLAGGWMLTNEVSGQEIMVKFWYADTAGVLSPYGFSRFVKTTPAWSSLAFLLHDDYFDAQRVIQVLDEAGCWEHIAKHPEVIAPVPVGRAAKLEV